MNERLTRCDVIAVCKVSLKTTTKNGLIFSSADGGLEAFLLRDEPITSTHYLISSFQRADKKELSDEYQNIHLMPINSKYVILCVGVAF